MSGEGRIGRPTKLTPEMHAAIVADVERGNFAETAAQLNGIDPRTFFGWMDRGRRGEEPFSQFFRAVTRARAKAEADALLERGQLGRVLADFERQGHQQAPALHGGQTAPGTLERCTGCRDRLVDVCCLAALDLVKHLAVGRIDHIDRFSAGRRQGLVGDEIQLHGGIVRQPGFLKITPGTAHEKGPPKRAFDGIGLISRRGT